MREPSPEREVTRDQVVAAYRKIRERGISNPDDMPLDDPEVQEAHRLFAAWHSAEEARAKAAGTKEAELELNLTTTVLMIEAGFDDPGYLEEIVEEFLADDLGEARRGESPSPSIAAKIKAKREEIERRLGR